VPTMAPTAAFVPPPLPPPPTPAASAAATTAAAGSATGSAGEEGEEGEEGMPRPVATQAPTPLPPPPRPPPGRASCLSPCAAAATTLAAAYATTSSTPSGGGGSAQSGPGGVCGWYRAALPRCPLLRGGAALSALGCSVAAAAAALQECATAGCVGVDVSLTRPPDRLPARPLVCPLTYSLAPRNLPTLPILINPLPLPQVRAHRRLRDPPSRLRCRG
jgi:hypothetical protein